MHTSKRVSLCVQVILESTGIDSVVLQDWLGFKAWGFNPNWNNPIFDPNILDTFGQVKCYSLHAEQLDDHKCEHLMKPRKYKPLGVAQDELSSEWSEIGHPENPMVYQNCLIFPH